MKEKFIKSFLYPILFVQTSILPTAIENHIEGCSETDTPNNTQYWVANEEGIPKRINPDPEAEHLEVWKRGTELIGECFRVVEIEINGENQKAIAHFMKAVEEDEDIGGWMITSIDHPRATPFTLPLKSSDTSE